MGMNKGHDIFGRLACPVCRTGLKFEGSEFRCAADPKHCFPVVRDIPRFVQNDAYVDSFSFEWNTHNRTQLDSFNRDKASEEQFIKKTGFTREALKGKLVLDAGVGAGRYTDVISKWGANAVGVDLSFAVESAHTNFADRPNVFIAQADISKLPFLPGTFDFIFSIGVLHHTPDTRKFFHYLIPLLKPGGTISIWVYPNEDEYAMRNNWIPYTSRIPDKMFYAWCRWFVPYVKKREENPIIGVLGRLFPISKQPLGMENDILDTFDAYSPSFHGIHSPEEVRGWFEEAGLVDIHSPSDWNTCMSGRRLREGEKYVDKEAEILEHLVRLEGPFRKENGNCFAASLPGYESAADTGSDGSRSKLLLYEDGKRLGPAHSLHDDIRTKGQGRYSHWGEGVLFSTSDNSDPNTNGKKYAFFVEDK